MKSGFVGVVGTVGLLNAGAVVIVIGADAEDVTRRCADRLGADAEAHNNASLIGKVVRDIYIEVTVLRIGVGGAVHPVHIGVAVLGFKRDFVTRGLRRVEAVGDGGAILKVAV